LLFGFANWALEYWSANDSSHRFKSVLASSPLVAAPFALHVQADVVEVFWRAALQE
jgi:hypothetical protein